MTKIQFTRTATQPHRNRKFRQFNIDQYCIQRFVECNTVLHEFTKLMSVKLSERVQYKPTLTLIAIEIDWAIAKLKIYASKKSIYLHTCTPNRAPRFYFLSRLPLSTVLILSKLKKNTTATGPQPNRTVLKIFCYI